MTARRTTQSAAWVVIAIVTSAIMMVLHPTPAGAVGSGGAGATGSGDTIISTILAGSSGGDGSGAGRPGDGGSGAGGPGGGAEPTAPVCSWRTLTDTEVLFVVHVAASMPELLDSAFVDAVGRWSTSDPSAAGGDSGSGFWDLQVRFCDGVAVTTDVRSVAVALDSSSWASVARGMLTRRRERRLPGPQVTVSPPAPADAVIGEPVFFALDGRQRNAEVSDSLTAGGRTVEVWARPAQLSLASGEPGDSAQVHRCSGWGAAFDPSPSAPSAGAQAGGPDACILRYERATGVNGRRDHWLGYVRLDWDAWFSVDGGPAQQLEGLFSYELFQRSVREVDTVIER